MRSDLETRLEAFLDREEAKEKERLRIAEIQRELAEMRWKIWIEDLRAKT